MNDKRRAALVATISGYLYHSEDVLTDPDDAAEAIVRMAEQAIAEPAAPALVGEPTLADRVAWAQTAMDAYLAQPGQNNRGEPDDLVDLLTNLMHWSSAKQISFARALGTAAEHYIFEAHKAEGDGHEA